MLGRFLAIVLTLSVVVVLTGCGDSQPAPPPAAAPVAGTPVADNGGHPLTSEIKSTERRNRSELVAYGRAAGKACKRAERRFKPWQGRLAALDRREPWSRASVESAGRPLDGAGQAAEYEFNLLRAIALPKQPEALETVEAFLNMEEETLVLVRRFGIELRDHDNLVGILNSARRMQRQGAGYERAARAAHASGCINS